MEFLDGLTLKHRIAGRPLELETLLALGIGDCRCAGRRARRRNRPPRHQAGQHFRDKRGHAKVLDFGLAKVTLDPKSRRRDFDADCGRQCPALNESRDCARDRGLHVSRTARGKELDNRTDLFSFGAVIYEMATGTVPFRGDTSAVIFQAILGRAPVSPVRLNPDLPAEAGTNHQPRHLRDAVDDSFQLSRKVRIQSHRRDRCRPRIA